MPETSLEYFSCSSMKGNSIWDNPLFYWTPFLKHYFPEFAFFSVLVLTISDTPLCQVSGSFMSVHISTLSVSFMLISLTNWEEFLNVKQQKLLALPFLFQQSTVVFPSEGSPGNCFSLSISTLPLFSLGIQRKLSCKRSLICDIV